jgi:putative membrane protein
MTEPTPHARTKADYVRLFFVGIAMGSADVVPGVSGGTMAFILGIYEELLNAIRSFNVAWLRLLFQGKLKAALEYVPWQFLLVLLLGIGTAFFSLAQVIGWALEHQTEYLFAFFFGLILASIIAVGALVRWSGRTIAAFLVGTLVAYVIVGLVPVEMSHDPLTLFLSGMVAIMAMILPGISGSFLLLILGQYEFVIDSVKHFALLPLLPLALGCVVGIIGFSRVLSWLLRRYEQITTAVLVGFMAGSLRRIWPWKAEASATGEHADLVSGANVLPDVTTGAFWLALLLCLIGFVLVCVLDHLHSGSNPLFQLIGIGHRREPEPDIATAE